MTPEQRLTEVEATLKILMQLMVPEFLSGIDTLARETLPTAVRKMETTVDRADRKLAMEHERLAALEGRVGAIEKALKGKPSVQDLLKEDRSMPRHMYFNRDKKKWILE